MFTIPIRFGIPIRSREMKALELWCDFEKFEYPFNRPIDLSYQHPHFQPLSFPRFFKATYYFSLSVPFWQLIALFNYSFISKWKSKYSAKAPTMLVFGKGFNEVMTSRSRTAIAEIFSVDRTPPPSKYNRLERR